MAPPTVGEGIAAVPSSLRFPAHFCFVSHSDQVRQILILSAFSLSHEVNQKQKIVFLWQTESKNNN